MKSIFNRDAVIATACMIGTALALFLIFQFTSDAEAMSTCLATRSIDTCESTLNP